MRARGRWAAVGALLVGLLMLTLAPQTAFAADPTFEQPTAVTQIDQPLTITSAIAGAEGSAVEVLVRLVGHEPFIVLPAAPATELGSWQASAAIDVQTSAACSCLADGQSPPNTRLEFQFRVTAPDGTSTLGPLGEAVVTDERFTWQTLEEDLVRVHWYEGDQAFARSAMDVANGAIDRASQLLGTTLPSPVDLFIYATSDAMRAAVSPNRENVAGEAHQLIRTMFVTIPPQASVSDFAGVLVAHELTHLVFNAATDNDYHSPPRWLDEGVAVYLSEGYADDWRAAVNAAVADRSVIPLQGLAGFFPSPTDQFFLAYGESVSAIDFFITTYGEQTLWDLVRSYANGLSDDDAFRDATGADLAAFNEAWMASLGVEVREPVGPQPGLPGPVPADWNLTGQPTAAPTAAASGPPTTVPSGAPTTMPTDAAGSPPATVGGPGATVAPTETPIPPSGGESDGTRTLVLALIVGVAVVLGVILLFLIFQRGGRRLPPQP